VNATTLKVLSGIRGHEDQCNDVVVCYSKEVSYHVILFPGDVQDYYENMANHRDNHVWKEYNLKDTALAMFHRFRNACVWVIRASKLHLNTFACYRNFVASNLFGVPSYSREEMSALLQTAYFIKHSIQHEFKENIQRTVSNLPISIIGFSKGCMVLNQMMYEWPLLDTATDETLRHFTNLIHELYWLDSGNCGQSGAWITDETCLKEVTKTVKFHLYVTPYQRFDAFRVWIGAEFEVFKKCLISLGAEVDEHLIFEDEEASLENHFKLLLKFRDPLTS